MAGQVLIVFIDNIRRCQKVRDTMPNASETIEKLAKELERLKFLNDLRDCETLDDFKNLTKKYEALCKEDNKK